MTKPENPYVGQPAKRIYAAGLIAGEQELIQTLIRLLKNDYFKYFVRGDMLDWLAAHAKKGKK